MHYICITIAYVIVLRIMLTILHPCSHSMPQYIDRNSSVTTEIRSRYSKSLQRRFSTRGTSARALKIIPIFYEAPRAFFTYITGGATSPEQRNFARKIAAVYTAARGTDTVTAVYDIQSYFSFNIIGARLPRCSAIYGICLFYINNHRAF